MPSTDSLKLAINSANEQRLQNTRLAIVSQPQEAPQLARDELLAAAQGEGANECKAKDENSAVRWAIYARPAVHMRK